MLNDLFQGQALLFSIPAIAGTLFFAIRLVMIFAGLGFGEVDGDLGGDHGAAAAGGTDDSTHMFKVLSIQAIGAFLMGFGWGGLGGLLGAPWEFAPSLFLGVAGGVAMVWLLSWLLKMVHDLQSSGTFSIQAALGAEGEVYATVPQHGAGVGQVRVVVDDRQRIYNASAEDDALPTGTRVRVIRVNDDNTLTVARS